MFLKGFVLGQKSYLYLKKTGIFALNILVIK